MFYFQGINALWWILIAGIIIILLIVPIMVILVILYVWKPSKTVKQTDKSIVADQNKRKYVSPMFSKSERIKSQRRKGGYSGKIEYRCYKCDTVINPAYKRCPKCGEELSF